MARLWALPLLFCSWALAAADGDWWRGAVIYEIYPRGFAGDLNGVTARLDYLKDLGVDAICIGDFGYDVGNYQAVDPRFGNMADFERLLREADKRGLKVINDMVLNHTSDQHPWFKQSKASRKNPKADWYVWRDSGPKGQPPNNWQSIYGHSAWSYEPSRKQYYYHAFYKEQPDLNFGNRAVREAMYDALRFWLDKGVAGFRLGAIASLFEDPQFRDESYVDGVNAFGERNLSRQYTGNLNEVHEALRELRKVTNEYPGRVLLGESRYSRNQDELHLPMDVQMGFINQLSARELRARLADAETRTGGSMPLLVFENHDSPRSLERYGDGMHNHSIARILATLLLTPRASALLYYGEELGTATSRNRMQWDTVEAESKDPTSLLHYYRRLIKLRKENAQLRDGDFAMTNEANEAVLSYARLTRDGGAVLIALNMTLQPQTISVDLASRGVKGTHLRTLVTSFRNSDQPDIAHISLPPLASYVAQVEP